MNLDNLKSLYTEELRDLYDAEQQMVECLDEVAEEASNDQLVQTIEDHLQETREHIRRLDQIFDQLGENPRGKTCKSMRGLVADVEEMMDKEGSPEVIDAGLIVGLQKMEHYEIAGYGSARTFARLLGRQDDERILQKTLDEEHAVDQRFTDLAERTINLEASRT